MYLWRPSLTACVESYAGAPCPRGCGDACGKPAKTAPTWLARANRKKRRGTDTRLKQLNCARRMVCCPAAEIICFVCCSDCGCRCCAVCRCWVVFGDCVALVGFLWCGTACLLLAWPNRLTNGCRRVNRWLGTMFIESTKRNKIASRP